MKHLDLTVFEPGETIGTLSHNGKVAIWSVAADGSITSAGNQLFGNTTNLTTDSPVEDLDLTVRTYNVLKRERINTVGDLMGAYDKLGAEGLLEIRNLGEKGVHELMDWIIRLRPDGAQ